MTNLNRIKKNKKILIINILHFPSGHRNPPSGNDELFASIKDTRDFVRGEAFVNFGIVELTAAWLSLFVDKNFTGESKQVAIALTSVGILQIGTGIIFIRKGIKRTLRNKK